MNNYSPIILFVYNRPFHTQKTVEALQKNDLAKDSILYIFSDGPKEDANKEQITKIDEVRKYIHQITGFKNVIIEESPINKGLANSIIYGVTKVINEKGRIIVLEDDLITSKYFLRYMNNMLSVYEKDSSVFSISADRPIMGLFEIPNDYKYDVFVSYRPYSCGWGTWINRWKKVDWTMEYFEGFIKDSNRVKAFNRGGADLTSMLVAQNEKRIDSWAIRFAYSHFKNHCIALLPCISYINNIGFDGTGSHSQNRGSQFYNDVNVAKKNLLLLDELYEDSRIINSFYNYFYQFTVAPTYRKPIMSKIINKIMRQIIGHNIIKYKKETKTKKIFIDA